MNTGEIIESSIWLTGDESPEMRIRYELDVSNAIDYLCHEHSVLHGPVTFSEKRPEEDHVPPVPDHIQGQRVRLLLAEAEIVGKAVVSPQGSFVANLEHKDLQKLRGIIRRERHKRGEGTLSNEVCDEIIEQIGPDAALDTLRILH